MKRIIFAFPLLLLLACQNDDNKNPPVGNLLTSGSWRASYFMDNNQDETYKFAGYNFTFNSGTVTASNGTNTVTGTYTDLSSDDSNPKFVLSFPETDPWDELNDDWRVKERSATLIKLEDQSGGNGDREHLHFTKN